METRTRISLPLPAGAVAEFESVWAVPLGGDLYRVSNVPFSAYGVNYGDTVSTAPSNTGPVMREVVSPSGHETYRVLIGREINPENNPTGR